MNRIPQIGSRRLNFTVLELQLRTELTQEVMTGIGSIGYAVRVSEQGKGYGTELLKQGFHIAKEHGYAKNLEGN